MLHDYIGQKLARQTVTRYQSEAETAALLKAARSQKRSAGQPRRFLVGWRFPQRRTAPQEPCVEC